MAKQSVDTLKGWFQTGDKPTQQQFYDWLDSFIHKDEGIDIEDIPGLQDALNSKSDNVAVNALRALVQPFRIELEGDDTYEAPPGFLIWKMVVTSDENAYLAIETEYNTGNILPPGDEPLFAGIPSIITCDIIAKDEPVNIWFRNVTGPTEILVYRLSLTPIN